jgi:hypothetical protein
MKVKVYDVEVEVGQQDGREGIIITAPADNCITTFLPKAGVRFLIAALTQMLAELK